MGGTGSGRSKDHSKRPLVTEARKIDLRHPEWKSLLASDRAAYITGQIINIDGGVI